MTIPFAFQSNGVTFIERCKGRALIAWEMGLGKSYLALSYAATHPECFPIVIVVPASLKYNWEAECVKHFGWRAEVVGGTKPHKTPLPSRPKIVIVNYDVLGPWLPHLLSLKPGLVIFDEIHYTSGRTTKRAKNSCVLADAVPRVIGLSGTPMTNRPADLWTPVRIINRTIFPSFYKYAHTHCGAKRKFWGWDFSGASNLEELNLKLRPIMSRLRKAEVLKDLPAQQNSVVLLDLPDRKAYEQARDEYLDWIGDRTPSGLSREEKDKSRGNLFALKHKVAQLKMPVVYDWIDSFLLGSDEKIISFGIHRESVVEAIHAKYANLSSLITGKVIGKHRQLAFDKFLRDKSCRLLSGNIDAAGVGLYAKGVSNTVFVELPWTPTKIDQGKGRTHGIGRGAKGVPCQNWFLIAKGTIEEKLLEILQRKRRVADKVLDAGVTEDPFKLYDELTAMLRAEKKPRR